MTKKIMLGYTVKDLVTGFKGIAIQKSEQLSGSVQFGIQPQVAADATVYPEAIFIDEHMIGYIDDGVSSKVTKPPADTLNVRLGAKVEDIATGFSGIATEKATFLNGCVFINVLPTADNQKLINENARASYVPIGRIKVLGDGIADKVKEPKANKEGKKPGGPSRPCARLR